MEIKVTGISIPQVKSVMKQRELDINFSMDKAAAKLNVTPRALSGAIILVEEGRPQRSSLIRNYYIMSILQSIDYTRHTSSEIAQLVNSSSPESIHFTENTMTSFLICNYINFYRPNSEYNECLDYAFKMVTEWGFDVETSIAKSFDEYTSSKYIKEMFRRILVIRLENEHAVA